MAAMTYISCLLAPLSEVSGSATAGTDIYTCVLYYSSGSHKIVIKIWPRVQWLIFHISCPPHYEVSGSATANAWWVRLF